MTDDAHKEKEKRRRKQGKRMSKILAKAWQLDESSTAFQEDSRSTTENVLCLTDIGQKLDQGSYRLGRHGWEDFARDLGGVYNRHLNRKTKKASLAQEHLEEVKKLLRAKDDSLSKLASESLPKEPNHSSSKKRHAEDSSQNGREKKRGKTTSKNLALAEREERAMDQLMNFVEERGGLRDQVSGFRARVTKKGTSGKFDTNYFNEAGRRFRSMLEVGRFLGLVNDGGSGSSVRKRGFPKKASSREQEAEKKKLRKELERLRKAHQRAMKSLDDFSSEDKDSRYPIDDRLLMEEDASTSSSVAAKGPLVSRTTCAAARVPDIVGFPGVPKHCVPDVIMSWDFLCTFHKALSLTPIDLDDFACALAYIPPEGQVLGDDVLAPPVYLSEAHLGLLKLLLQDKSSNEWWWSTIETDESELVGADLDETEGEKDDTGAPSIRVDMAALLAEAEDPLITTSWLRALDDIGDCKGKPNEVKGVVKTALKVVSNKWVTAYLRKALEGCKSFGAPFTKKAITWLIDRVREARPDLSDGSVSQEEVFKARALVVEKAGNQMESLPDSVPAVTDEEVVSDADYDEDEESDESDDEGLDEAKEKERGEVPDAAELPASIIPPKPLPSLVDMLLPPANPNHNAEYINPFSWSHMVGAVASRVLHRRKRVWNEVDDSLRFARELPPLLLSERRHREDIVSSRVLTECVEDDQEEKPLEKAIELLCSGGNYLDIPTVGRLCILRLLIEASYDTKRIFETVDNNYMQRTNALKALDLEQRRAKKEAKEKALANERAAREQLSLEAKEKFLDEKRDEIRKLNEKSNEFSEEVIESLTDEDILEFDEDIKADYESLPGPESFNKTEVGKMVKRIQEESAFDTEALRVLTMNGILEREKVQLEEMEGQLLGFGGPDALGDPSLDRETVRSIERLERDLEKASTLSEKLPEQREKAMAQLKDAIEDGTIKVLRSAVAAAKKAKLTGPDDETGGVWALDLMRDAAVELENAKQNKRVIDAQKELVAKRNKCFIRTEPLGLDRFGNRLWSFSNAEAGHFWVETEFELKTSESATAKPPPGFLDLSLDASSITCGARDMEEDLIGTGEADSESFRIFSRREFHSAGFAPKLAKHHWGCHATEDSLRAIIKNLDSRGVRENDLKKTLKEAIEETVGSEEKQFENAKEERAAVEDAEDPEDPSQDTAESEGTGILTSGDEDAFREAKRASRRNEEVSKEVVDNLTTGIAQPVRVRRVIDESTPKARYEQGTVTGWTTRREKREFPPEIDDDSDEEYTEEPPEPVIKIVEIPSWRVLTDRGHVVWLDGIDLMESLSRHDKWKNGCVGYFENDVAFLSYRNGLGRHCGRAADAPYASSPNAFARLMVKKEGDLYAKLKIRNYDNNWGGKSGSRALWTNSMKDYASDFQTAKQGLLTLENAFFELTGEFTEYENENGGPEPDAEALLNDPLTRVDIELESIDKNIKGLWNSSASRAVFLYIVSNCKTTGFLALSLDLLCRNTMKYLQTHKLLNTRASRSLAHYEEEETIRATATRSTRRMNAWQQANQDW